MSEWIEKLEGKKFIRIIPKNADKDGEIIKAEICINLIADNTWCVTVTKRPYTTSANQIDIGYTKTLEDAKIRVEACIELLGLDK